MSSTTVMPTPTRADKVRQAKQTLEEHVQSLAEQMRQGKSENLIRYLEFSAQFHHYSFGNILLAICQRSGITRLAGLRQWNKLGRRVKAGERGMMILAPMAVWNRPKEEAEPASEEETIESEREETREKVTIFKPVYVFDVSQTEGAELPALVLATGDADTVLPALKEAVREADIALEELDWTPGSATAHGASYGGRIVIRRDLNSAEAFLTLAHEFAHELLHWPKDGTSEASRGVGKEPNKTIRETEAEAAAFVVCRHFGITANASDYLLLYDSNSHVLLSRLETIRRTAARIIGEIERTLGIADPSPGGDRASD